MRKMQVGQVEAESARSDLLLILVSTEELIVEQSLSVHVSLLQRCFVVVFSKEMLVSLQCTRNDGPGLLPCGCTFPFASL
jgi:hypothetical protein